MPTLPDVFIVPDVPASELPAMRKETELEGLFTLTESDNGDGTFDVTFTRIKTSGAGSGAP
jgi:hypothetical protein